MNDSDGIEKGQVIESMLMRETKLVAKEALSEPDEAYNKTEVAFLKQNWITDAIQKLDSSESTVINAADANLEYPNHRAFLEAYLRHLGTPLEYKDIYNLVKTNGENLPKIQEGQQLDFPTDPRVAWLEEAGGRGKLVSTTKIDGLQVVIDTDKVAKGPTTGLAHTVLRFSDK